MTLNGAADIGLTRAFLFHIFINPERQQHKIMEIDFSEFPELSKLN